MDVGPWASEKLDCLRKYLEAYTMILSRRHFRGDFYIEERSGAFTANERGPEPV